MTKTIGTILLTSLFVFGLIPGLKAQDKYEYAIVHSFNFKVLVTTHTTEKFASKSTDIEAAVIMKVEEMTNEGWEVFNTAATSDSNGAVGSHVFYLRKKVKE